MHIVILGPVNAPALSKHLYPGNAERARVMDGNHGTAPSGIASALLDLGHRVTVVSYRRGEGEVRLTGPRCEFIQVPAFRSGARQALDWWRHERQAMVAEVRRVKPDIVHAHWTYEWALAAIESGNPYVITVRDAPWTVLKFMPNPYRLLRFLLAWYVRYRARGRVLTAVSPYMARTWQREMCWHGPVTIVPNPVPADLALTTVRRTETPSIIEIADSGRRKNVKKLIEAFNIVRRDVPHASLLLVGRGLSRGEPVSDWAVARGLDAGVQFVGRVDRPELSQLMQQAWVHAHVAFEESFGNTLLEAMQAGTPVLGGVMSGAVPWVLAGGAGSLVDITDEEAIAAELVALLKNESRRHELVAAAHHRLDEVYSPQAVVGGYIETYQQVLHSCRVENHAVQTPPSA